MARRKVRGGWAGGSEGGREGGSDERGGSLRMAGATVYGGDAAPTARTEGADTAEAEAARGGSNMAAGQSVSNRRAKRSFYAVTWRARA